MCLSSAQRGVQAASHSTFRSVVELTLSQSCRKPSFKQDHVIHDKMYNLYSNTLKRKMYGWMYFMYLVSNILLLFCGGIFRELADNKVTNWHEVWTVWWKLLERCYHPLFLISSPSDRRQCRLDHQPFSCNLSTDNQRCWTSQAVMTSSNPSTPGCFSHLRNLF